MSLGVGNGASKTASGPLTPPTVAPVLIATASNVTGVLDWTASDKVFSPGFSYRIELSIASESFNPINSTTQLFYSDQHNEANGETYTYRVTPYNSAGDGPTSNTASIILPEA